MDGWMVEQMRSEERRGGVDMHQAGRLMTSSLTRSPIEWTLWWIDHLGRYVDGIVVPDNDPNSPDKPLVYLAVLIRGHVDLPMEFIAIIAHTF